LHATFVYRFGRALHALNRSPAVLLALPFWPLYLLCSVLIRKCYGITLALSADIGVGLYVGHFGGVRLEHCTLGSECSLAQQTTVTGPEDGNGALRIGSRVWIGAHTRIVGAINVGDGATIGAGSRVTSDVAPRSLVMGNPARCVNTAYDNTAFLFPKRVTEA
jgi:serine O-acetyltransferase